MRGSISGVTMGGRRGIGSTGGGGAPAPALYAVAGLSSTDLFSTSAAGRPALSTTSTIAVICRRITGSNVVREYRVECWTSGTRGFRFLPALDGTAARAIGTMVSSTPANVSEINTYTPPQNELQRMIMVRDASGISIYRNGALMSAAAAITGYTAPTTEAFVISGSSTVVDEFEIVSISISDSYAMSAGDITTYDTTVKALGSRIIPSATHHWEAADISGGAWVDQIAAVSLTQSGSPTVRDITGAVWT
jgi:hypothetical protein